MTTAFKSVGVVSFPMDAPFDKIERKPKVEREVISLELEYARLSSLHLVVAN